MKCHCKIKGCKGKVIARHLCWKHLQRWYRHKDNITLKVGRKKIKVCKCGKPRNMRLKSGLCQTCYDEKVRWYSNKYRQEHPARVRRYQQKCYWKGVLGKA